MSTGDRLSGKYDRMHTSAPALHLAHIFLVAWNSSSVLRERVNNAISEIQMYRTDNQRTSQGLRLEFWRKSVEFILKRHSSVTEQDRSSRFFRKLRPEKLAALRR
jgi:hypothetical protein